MAAIKKHKEQIQPQLFVVDSGRKLWVLYPYRISLWESRAGDQIHDA